MNILAPRSSMQAIRSRAKPFPALNKQGQIARLKRLAQKALLDFGVEATHLVPLEHMANTTFRVEAERGDRYVIRIQTPSDSTAIPERTEAQIRSEMEWLTAISRDTDLVVPVPVCTLDGMPLTKVQVEGVPEVRTCVLLRWVDGRFINKGLTAGHLERVGVFMARLHEHATRRFRPSEEFTRRTPDDLSGEVAGAMLNVLAQVRPQEDIILAEAVLENMRAVFAYLGAGLQVFGLIHADLHQDNYLFRHGQVRAIDFDDCGYGHFLYDLAVTLNEVMHKPAYPQLRSGLLRGYRSVRPLSVEHESYLDTFIAFRELQLITWVIEQRNHPAFSQWEEDAMYGLQRIKTLTQARS